MILEKVLKMYDVETKAKFEREKSGATPRTMLRLQSKVNHLAKIV